MFHNLSEQFLYCNTHFTDSQFVNVMNQHQKLPPNLRNELKILMKKLNYILLHKLFSFKCIVMNREESLAPVIGILSVKPGGPLI